MEWIKHPILCFEYIILFIFDTKQSPVKTFSAPKWRKCNIKTVIFDRFLVKMTRLEMQCFTFTFQTKHYFAGFFFLFFNFFFYFVFYFVFVLFCFCFVWGCVRGCVWGLGVREVLCVLLLLLLFLFYFVFVFVLFLFFVLFCFVLCFYWYLCFTVVLICIELSGKLEIIPSGNAFPAYILDIGTLWPLTGVQATWSDFLSNKIRLNLINTFVMSTNKYISNQHHVFSIKRMKNIPKPIEFKRRILKLTCYACVDNPNCWRALSMFRIASSQNEFRFHTIANLLRCMTETSPATLQ